MTQILERLESQNKMISKDSLLILLLLILVKLLKIIIIPLMKILSKMKQDMMAFTQYALI